MSRIPKRTSLQVVVSGIDTAHLFPALGYAMVAVHHKTIPGKVIPG